MVEPSGVDKRQRRVARLVLIAGSLVYLLSLPPAVMAAFMSPMAFDSGESPGAWAFLAGCVAYPLLVVAALIAAWVLFARQRHRAAMFSLLLPVVGTPVAAGVAAVTLGR